MNLEFILFRLLYDVMLDLGINSAHQQTRKGRRKTKIGQNCYIRFKPCELGDNYYICRVLPGSSAELRPVSEHHQLPSQNTN